MNQNQTSSPSEIPFQQVLDALLDADTPLNPRFLYRLSDLEKSEIAQLQQIWPQIALWRRQALLEDMQLLNEKDSLLSFEAFGRFAVNDEDPKVRQLALETLADYDETSLVSIFIDSLKTDQAAMVRAAAATGLARFVYAGEIEELPQRLLHEIEELLLKTYHSSDAPEVRRAALAALGYSSRAEVDGLIESAFASDDRQWKATALFAMGRSANSDWEPRVIDMLQSNYPLLREEAARAAGELELRRALPTLMEMLDDPDPNTLRAVIWSLSQIGGEGVQEVLQRLYKQADDEAELDLIEAAMENLTFNENMQLMPLFESPEGEEAAASEDDDEGWYEEVDLEDLDDLYDEDEYASDDDLYGDDGEEGEELAD
jgi:HEAT repeat protein